MCSILGFFASRGRLCDDCKTICDFCNQELASKLAVIYIRSNRPGQGTIVLYRNKEMNDAIVHRLFVLYCTSLMYVVRFIQSFILVGQRRKLVDVIRKRHNRGSILGAYNDCTISDLKLSH